jgi:hypothetical protein
MVVSGSMIPIRRSLFLLPLAAAVGLACNSNGLAPAIFTNVVDTVTIGALVGTPITVPSAFSVSDSRAVRSDQTSAFDFAFNIDQGGHPVFLPLAVIGLVPKTSAAPGLRTTTLAFADIVSAQSDGYITQDTVHIAVGDRFFLRSRIACGLLGVPEYGKLEVLAVDESARTVTFQVLTNNNCGYRDLTPGLPDN